MASKDEEKDGTHNEWKQIKDEITCSICGELFKKPKTLPCLHTFCKECIQTSLDTAERMKGQKTCPLCRSPVPKDGIASIPTNFAINRLIEIFNSRRTRDDNHAVKCDECDSEDGAVACMWCVDCEKGLCEECFKPHTRSKSLKSHKAVTIDEFTKSPKAMLATAPKPQYCSTLGHDGQQLELYCHTCSQLICRDCTYTDHPRASPRGEHQFEFLKKVIVSKNKQRSKRSLLLYNPYWIEFKLPLRRMKHPNKKLIQGVMVTVIKYIPSLKICTKYWMPRKQNCYKTLMSLGQHPTTLLILREKIYHHWRSS